MKTKLQQGFSLTEILVTVAILTVISLIIALGLSQNFKGNVKTDLISTIKQNGSTAISLIEQDLKNTDSIICYTPSTVLVIKSRDGKYYRYIMQVESGTTNGYLERHEFTLSSSLTDAASQLKLCDPTQDTNPPPPLIPNKQVRNLIDSASTSRNPVSLKSTNTPGFTISKTTGYKDVVTIQFDLGSSPVSKNTFENQIGNNNNAFSFKTSVGLR